MFDEDEDEEPIEPVGPGSDLPDIMLHRLYQCACTSRRGMLDQGFPRLHSQMEARGIVESFGNGYRVTAIGLEMIRAQRSRLRRI